MYFRNGATEPSLTPRRLPVTSRAMTDATDGSITELSFEEALKRLETIVHRLESGEASLDEAITLYGEGDRLRQQCEARLKSAEARIEKIVAGGDGRAAGVRPFDEA